MTKRRRGGRGGRGDRFTSKAPSASPRGMNGMGWDDLRSLFVTPRLTRRPCFLSLLDDSRLVHRGPMVDL